MQCSHCGANINREQLNDDFCLYCGTILPHAAALLKTPPSPHPSKPAPKRPPAATPALDRLPIQERQQLIKKATEKLRDERLRIRAEVRQELSRPKKIRGNPDTFDFKLVAVGCVACLAGVAIALFYSEAHQTTTHVNELRQLEASYHPGKIVGACIIIAGLMTTLSGYLSLRPHKGTAELRNARVLVLLTAVAITATATLVK